MRYPLFTFLMLATGAESAAPPAAESSTVLGTNTYLSAGAQALMVRNFAEGIELTLMGLRSESPRRTRALAFSNLCAGYVALEQYSLAVENCDAALKLRPRLWRAYNNRALAYLGQNRLSAARNDIEQGLAINPTSRTLTESRTLVQQKLAQTTLAAAPSPPDEAMRRSLLPR